MDKSALRQAIVRRLEAELALQTAAAYASRDEATGADSRAEGRYDMRAQSAAYLAAGQAKLATEISEAMAAYRALALPAIGAGGVIVTGAVVILESEGRRRSAYFIGPSRGGMEIDCSGVEVTVITAVSPLGRQLIGRRVGDSATLPGAKGSVVYRVVEVE
jgi:transcription elongation GreA/GreB family factor